MEPEKHQNINVNLVVGAVMFLASMIAMKYLVKLLIWLG
jgi:hypothetical protein